MWFCRNFFAPFRPTKLCTAFIFRAFFTFNMPTKHLVRFFILALRCLVIFSDFPTRVLFCAYALMKVGCAGCVFAYDFFFRDFSSGKCAATMWRVKQSLRTRNLTFLLAYFVGSVSNGNDLVIVGLRQCIWDFSFVKIYIRFCIYPTMICFFKRCIYKWVYMYIPIYIF